MESKQIKETRLIGSPIPQSDTAQSERLFNRGLLTVVGAQFFSALADNAIFFTLLEFFNRFNYPNYSTYILQGFFIAFYILLAPIVGVIADEYPKGRILMIGNGAKLLGIILLILKVDPFICYAIVGLGAAIYSPAKFGILSELVHKKLLVKANGLIEGSTIIAILFGAYLGGLVAQNLGIYIAIIMVFGIYLLALIANLYIPKITPKLKTKTPIRKVVAQFIHTIKVLLFDPRARFAIFGTSLFWGATSTLRLLLNDWVREVLGKGTEMVSILSAVASIGVVIGAVIASLFIKTDKIGRCIWAGFFMGIITLLFAYQSNLYVTYLLLIMIGTLGGAFVIPLNALLQERGNHFEGTGRAIAAQNFFENFVMLIMMGIFGFLSYLDIGATLLMAGFGLLFALFMILLGWQCNPDSK